MAIRMAWLSLSTDKRAVTAMEYCLIAAMIALVIIGSVTTLGSNVTKPLATVSNTLSK